MDPWAVSVIPAGAHSELLHPTTQELTHPLLAPGISQQAKGNKDLATTCLEVGHERAYLPQHENKTPTSNAVLYLMVTIAEYSEQCQPSTAQFLHLSHWSQ